MKNNAIISEMFEEIKAQLGTIEKKLDGQESRQKTIEEERRLRNNRTAIESVLQQISGHLSTIHSETTEIPTKIQESQELVLSKLELVQLTVSEQEQERTVRHHHVIDLKSSKVVVAFVILTLVLFGAIAGNVYQYRKSKEMSDNDLKYRYIKTLGGINAKDLSRLEDIFYFHRDKNLIKKIKDDVEEFEEVVKKQAEERERRRLE